MKRKPETIRNEAHSVVTVPPALRFDDFALVPPDTKYLSTLRAFENVAPTTHLWTQRRRILTESEFEEQFASQMLHYFDWYFVIIDSHDYPIGFIYAYHAQPNDCFFLTTYIQPDRRGGNLAVRAVCTFLHWVFSNFDMKRVLCDVFDYNVLSRTIIERAGFEESGRIQRARYFQGEYHGFNRYELSRGDFYAKHSRLITRHFRSAMLGEPPLQK